jgi:hypothetical protein
MREREREGEVKIYRTRQCPDSYGQLPLSGTHLFILYPRERNRKKRFAHSGEEQEITKKTGPKQIRRKGLWERVFCLFYKKSDVWNPLEEDEWT